MSRSLVILLVAMAIVQTVVPNVLNRHERAATRSYGHAAPFCAAQCQALACKKKELCVYKKADEIKNKS
ncbi:hypothetical protein OSTOST_14627, partial [Ostertagia ostertagi]